jgi:hypothetical protein
MRLVARIGRWVAIFCGVVFLLLIVVNGPVFVLQVPFLLALGWIAFLLDSWSRLHVGPAAIGGAVLCLVLLCLGAQRFLGWLWPLLRDDATARWPWRWTLSGIALLGLLFSAATATIGVVHQVSWLVRTDGRLIESSWGPLAERNRARSLCRGLEAAGQDDAARRAALTEAPQLYVVQPPARSGRATLLVPSDPMRRPDGFFRCDRGEAEELPGTALAEALEQIAAPVPSPSSTPGPGPTGRRTPGP